MPRLQDFNSGNLKDPVGNGNGNHHGQECLKRIVLDLHPHFTGKHPDEMHGPDSRPENESSGHVEPVFLHFRRSLPDVNRKLQPCKRAEGRYEEGQGDKIRDIGSGFGVRGNVARYKKIIERRPYIILHLLFSLAPGYKIYSLSCAFPCIRKMKSRGFMKASSGVDIIRGSFLNYYFIERDSYARMSFRFLFREIQDVEAG